MHLRDVLALAFLSGAAPAVAQEAGAALDEPAPESPPMTAARYDEDFSYLRDPRQRSGAWWERFKLIPIDENAWAYLTLGDDARLRFELYRDDQFGSTPLATDTRLRYRHMPSIGLSLGPNVRLFAQAIFAFSSRDEATKHPATDETGGDVLQALALMRLPLEALGEVTLQAGRQVLEYGSGRIINTGPNIRLSFDGAVARWEREGLRVDAFYLRPVRSSFDWLDNEGDEARRLWSTYGTVTFREAPRAGIDLFYLGYENEAAAFHQGEAQEWRHTLGTRLFGTEGPLHIDLEGHLQLGTFGDAPIFAWGVLFQSRYTFWGVPLEPWLGTRLTALSGDQDPEDPALNTYNALFPEGGYHGETGVIGPGNLLAAHQTVGVDLGDGFTTSLTGILFFRQSLGDGTYGLGGNLLRSPGGSDAHYIATQGELAFGWAPNPYLYVHLLMGALLPGQYIADTGPARTVYIITSHVQYSF